MLEAISDLLKKNLIVECEERPCIVNPLSVSVQSSGKLKTNFRYEIRQQVFVEKQDQI